MLEGDEFQKYLTFLTKVRVSRTDTEHKFLVTYPKKFESQMQIKRYFELLLFFWFTTMAMEKEENQPKTAKCDYSR